MKHSFFFSYALFFLSLALFTSCELLDDFSDDNGTDGGNDDNQEEIVVSIEDFETTIDENPEPGQSLGIIDAFTNQGVIGFSLISQNPEGAIEINTETGELFVLDDSLFLFADNPVISSNVLAQNGSISAQASITINLKELLTGSSKLWTGPSIVFEKLPDQDETLEENQDRLTENVWITRGSRAGLFNINQESSYSEGAPADTEWAKGTLDNYENLTYTDWKTATNENPPSSVNSTFVVHLISDDIFLEIKFLSWGVQRGGNFSYERTTPN